MAPLIRYAGAGKRLSCLPRAGASVRRCARTERRGESEREREPQRDAEGWVRSAFVRDHQ